MKRIILLIIPIILVIIIVFGIFKLFILADAGKGALQITSHPLSKVYLNNAFIGNTPLCRCEANTMVSEGEYTVKLVPLDSGFDEFQEKITVTKGVLTVVDRKFGKGATSEGSIISLTPLPDKHATELLVLSFPDKTAVFVDSNASGNTPLSVKKLTDSDHTLKLKRDGYIDKNVRIRTPAGYRLTATVYMALNDESGQVIPTPTQPTIVSGTPSPSPSLGPSPTGAKNPTPTKPGPTAKVSGKITILSTPNGFLRVRETPSTAAAEISRVETGETYPLVEEQTGWYKIKLTDGTEGWVSASYASKQ
jgi:hypothetical protein